MLLRVRILYKQSRFRTVIHRTLLVLYTIEVIIFVIQCLMSSIAKLTSMWNKASCYEHPIMDIRHSPDHTAHFIQVEVLKFSFCAPYLDSQLGLWIEIVSDIVQIAFSILMCLLVATRFVAKSLQVYRATKQFELGYYMNLFTREGLFYFLVYVHILSFILPTAWLQITVDRILTYTLFDLLDQIPASIIPADTFWWWDITSPILQPVPAITLTPRLVLTVQKLYARAQRTHEIDSTIQFGFSSVDSNRDEGGTFLFESTVQNEGMDQGEEVEMVDMETPAAGPSRAMEVPTVSGQVWFPKHNRCVPQSFVILFIVCNVSLWVKAERAKMHWLP